MKRNRRTLKEGSAKGSARNGSLIRALGTVVIAGVIAAAIAAWLQDSGTSAQWQRIAAFFIVGGALTAASMRWRLGPDDVLTTAITVIASAALMLAALTYTGFVDPDPEEGCLNTHGELEATVAVSTLVVRDQPTLTSEPRALLTTGCIVRGDAWCAGPPHLDAFEGKFIHDARWLSLSGDQGFVPYGQVTGPSLSPERQFDQCDEGRPPPPTTVTFRSATVAEDGSVALRARAEDVAFIGFAIQTRDDRWTRLGWDYQPENRKPTVLKDDASEPVAGDQIAAIPCLGYQQPAKNEGSAVAEIRALRSTQATLRRDPERDADGQPVGPTAEDAACDSGIRELEAPYTEGVAGAAR